MSAKYWPPLLNSNTPLQRDGSWLHGTEVPEKEWYGKIINEMGYVDSRLAQSSTQQEKYDEPEITE